jgi:hypothetical protein
MSIVTPFWFAQRQGKVEPKGTDAYELSAPNLKPAIIQIRQGPTGRWAGILRAVNDGPEMVATEDLFERPEQAWEAAFELFRLHHVV